MIIKFDILPNVEYTGSSTLHGERSYYFNDNPPIQFVLWGIRWEDIKLGDKFDANVGVSNYRGGCGKVTLRGLVDEDVRADLLSELVDNAKRMADAPPVVLYLDEQEREKLVRMCSNTYTASQLFKRLLKEAVM